MKKFIALCLSLLLSLSLTAPAALCAGEEEPLPSGQEEPVTPTDPGEPGGAVLPMSDGEVPDLGIVTL